MIKTGSINETDKQLGYAHLLEHLAFKKGKNFKKQSVTNFLKQQGLQVGKHYNAVTNYDYTLYQVKIPNNNLQLQRKIILFFADILNGLQFTEKDLETEKKIVLAEKNAREKPDKIFNLKLGNSLYKKRLPIGTEKSIKKATTQKIRAFYKKWYQPKNCAIFVVGNINLKKIYTDISDVLGTISNGNSEIFETKSIFETLENNTTIFQKNDKLKQTKLTILLALKRSENSEKDIFNAILRNRIKRVLDENNIQNTIFYDYFLSDVGYFTITSNTDNSKEVLRLIFTELKRLKDFKISKKELEFYKNRNSRKNVKNDFSNIFIMDEVVKNYLKNKTFEYQKNTDKNITISDIDNYKKLFFANLKNLIYIENSTEKITNQDIKNLLQNVQNQYIEPYKFQKKTQKQKVISKIKDLEIKKITPQKPISINYFSKLNVTKLTYQNGINILLKPIKNGTKKYSIIAKANGGYKTISDKNYHKFESAESYVSLGGVANLSSTEKENYLSDKSFGLSLTILDFERLIHAHTTQKNQKDFFKFLNATLTDVKPNKYEFDKVITEKINYLKNKPIKSLSSDKDKLTATLLGDYFPNRKLEKSEKDYKELDVFEMKKFYDKAFKYANNWNYVIVGDFSVNEIIPLLNKYIGSLKTTLNSIKNTGFNYSKLPEYQKNRIHNKNKNYILVSYFHYNCINLKENLLLLMYEKYLQLKITELLRKKRGFVYAPSVELHTKNAIAMLKIDYYCDVNLFEKSKKTINDYLRKRNKFKLNDILFEQVKMQVKLEYNKFLSSEDLYLWSSKLIENTQNINELENINNLFANITKEDFFNFIIKANKNKVIKTIEFN